jgi:hypothetical protein
MGGAEDVVGGEFFKFAETVLGSGNGGETGDDDFPDHGLIGDRSQKDGSSGVAAG